MHMLDFEQLLRDYLLDQSEDRYLPYQNGCELNFQFQADSNEWRVFFTHEGNSHHTVVNQEDLLGWMWMKMRDSLKKDFA